MLAVAGAEVEVVLQVRNVTRVNASQLGVLLNGSNVSQ